jgi:peptidoglycan hydrolase-like protein with peptidoglycan-binding domain
MSYSVGGGLRGLGAGEDEIVACGKYTGRDLQQKLTDLGYYKGPIDGRPNPAYMSAVGRFLADHGLTLGSSEEDFCSALDKALGARWNTPVVLVVLGVAAAGGIWWLSRKKK